VRLPGRALQARGVDTGPRVRAILGHGEATNLEVLACFERELTRGREVLAFLGDAVAMVHGDRSIPVRRGVAVRDDRGCHAGERATLPDDRVIPTRGDAPVRDERATFGTVRATVGRDWTIPARREATVAMNWTIPARGEATVARDRTIPARRDATIHAEAATFRSERATFLRYWTIPARREAQVVDVVGSIAMEIRQEPAVDRSRRLDRRLDRSDRARDACRPRYHLNGRRELSPGRSPRRPSNAARTQHVRRRRQDPPPPSVENGIITRSRPFRTRRPLEWPLRRPPTGR
jgi:hypothetical protein